MSHKSSTCTSKKTGKPLSVYTSEADAQESADYARSQYNSDMAPYKCRKCGQWHLSPKDRHTPSTKCRTCTGSDGKRKDLYSSETAAEKRAAILLKEQGVSLKVYKCLYSDGWHLAKDV